MIYCSHSGLILDLERGKQQRTWLDCKAAQRKALLWESAWLICIWICYSGCRSRCGSLINRPCPLFLHTGLLIYVSTLLGSTLGWLPGMNGRKISGGTVFKKKKAVKLQFAFWVADMNHSRYEQTIRWLLSGGFSQSKTACAWEKNEKITHFHSVRMFALEFYTCKNEEQKSQSSLHEMLPFTFCTSHHTIIIQQISIQKYNKQVYKQIFTTLSQCLSS